MEFNFAEVAEAVPFVVLGWFLFCWLLSPSDPRFNRKTKK